MVSLLQRMKKQIDDNEKNRGGSFNPAIFPIFGLKIGESATIRLLPGMDEKYDTFWTQKKMVPMFFADPNDPTKELKFLAPCLEMYGPEHEYRGMNSPTGCPILKKVRPLYKDAEALTKSGKAAEGTRMKTVADRHWVSKYTQTFYQGFVNKSDLQEKNLPENPIRIFIMAKKLHDKIFDSIFKNKNEEEAFTTLPTGEFSIDDIKQAMDSSGLSDDEAKDLLNRLNGRNFIINVSGQGMDEVTGKPYNDYATKSAWSVKESGLTDEQIAALNQYGFHDLRKQLPPQPTDEQYELMGEMMDISIARAFGDDEGFWNPDWEKAGMKPLRPRESKDSAEGETKSTTGYTPKSPAAAGAGSVASRLANRGKAPATAPAEEPTKAEAPAAAPAQTQTVAETQQEPVTQTQAQPETKVSDILLKLRNKNPANAKV